MGWRSEVEDKQTVKCKKCKKEFILIWQRRKPNQKWANHQYCPYCK